MPRGSLDGLFLEHVGPSLAKHLALLDAVAGLRCDIDLDRGEARFGDRYTFGVQLLGLEDEEARIWRWSWSLPEASVPRPLVQAALELKAWGEAHDLDLFYVPSFELKQLSGDDIAILSCGLAGSDSFLAANTDALGAAFFLIPDLQGQVPSRHAAAFLTGRVLPLALTSYGIPDHRAVVRHLLGWAGFSIAQQGTSAWKARRADGSRITVTFDRQGRVAKVKAHDEAPAPKS